MSKLSHLDDTGAAVMVDISGKDDTSRTAVAKGSILMQSETLAAIEQGSAAKGDVLAVARIAGIMAAKRTADLIPLCHPLAIASVAVDLGPLADRSGIEITATVKVNGQTGVEMEALTAVSIAALTVYDMTKAVDKGMTIGDIRLISKEGGKSGSYQREARAELDRLRAGKKAPRRPPVAAAVGAAPTARDALRAFMVRHGIKVTDWARQADVRTGELFSFLNGRSAALAPETAKRLAKAAGVTVKDLFAG